ncbi:MAG: glycerol kinase GlpK [Lachnospiraceae bacterium]|nr:glycerol kinase GlpK [Butyrivibrio sp.]MCM1343907.1 glycerol kinase GlpK [Muribaculaceae bacterium]MCM1408933.1 glycerol kinase GlpK [Lachnospiraceae bacterium]
MKQQKYIISIDQSTQGTKALLFDEKGALLLRTDLPHCQIVNEQGWVSHDLNEIYHNTVRATELLVRKSGIRTEDVAAVGISNQRETTGIWDRMTGEPLDLAVVWQCGRAGGIVEKWLEKGYGELVKRKTGIPLSAYFPAAKMAWLLQNVRTVPSDRICLGTIDSWLIYKLTEDHAFKTDYSNASRTQLFHLETLEWDEELCGLFGIPRKYLAEVCDSDAVYGYTSMEGLFQKPVPICGVLGDSHGALFGQGCLKPGMVKATYGTGSSLMMHVGDKPVRSEHGVVSSIAWSRRGKAEYVLEGNLNYTGAVITWLKDDVKLIASPKETEELAFKANPRDTAYLVPAFTGLGAPYWKEKAKACICGMSRTTGKAELVKAGLECTAYQIMDLTEVMERDTGTKIRELCADGGPAKNTYLMQFQSNLLQGAVKVPEAEELSGIGAAYMAGISAGVYREDEIFGNQERKTYLPKMEKALRDEKYVGWKEAVESVLR